MTQDLSARHGMISNLFSRSASSGDLERYRLTEDQVRFYEENGYVSGIQILNDSQIEALRAELEALTNPAHPGHGLFYEFHSNESSDPATVLFHALGAWRIATGFHDLLWHPAFTIPAAQLLGGPVRFWHDQLFCKPAHHGGVVAWHQDYSYWTRTRPMGHLTCWIGLDDADRENGCICYIPGSHRWELLPVTGLAGDMNSIHTVLRADQKRQFKPVHVELKAGEAAFHHPLMVHGSYENRTARSRRATVINVFLDGTRSGTNELLLDGVPPIPDGEEMGGRFYPLLSSPSAGS
jgi:ectoine hydroxylase-related dioxygenase (phytanoyl-CoA dioxygenase family)